MSVSSYFRAASLIAMLAATGAAWAYAAGISITGVSTPALGFVGRSATAAIYARRDRRIADLAACAAVLVGFTATGAVLSYLVVTIRVSPADAVLAAADRALGFYWIAWSDAVAARPWLNLLLSAAYWSLLPSIILALIVLSATRRSDRCIELIWVIMMSGIATITVSGLFPAVSAPVWFGVPERANMAGVLYAPYLQDTLALHGGTFRALNLANASGLISFPSYHATLTLLVAHAMRGTRLFWAMVILAGLTLLSVPSVGLHYLVDIPGGAAVALVTIVIVRRACNSRSVSGAAVARSDRGVLIMCGGPY